MAQKAQEENVSEEEEPILVKEKKKLEGEGQRKELDKGKNKIEERPQEYTPKVPIFNALKPKPHKKLPVQQEELMELFKQVNINIPLLDAIKHVLVYAKFLKELCTPKREPKSITQKI